MLDGILGRSNFKTKCKSALTRTVTRLEIVKKKRNAVLKFLKEDVAELLKSNLDRNAYSRAEGLYMELNQSSCYDYVEECCKCIADHLKDMHKQSECPEECRVAASSLIYAAARFADLPDLRDLRTQLNEKYGKTLDPFVSKEFVDKLKFKPPTKEMKLRLMQGIAREFSIPWDPKPLEQQLQGHTPMQDQNYARSRSGMTEGKEKQDNGEKHINEGIRLLHSQSSRENANRTPFMKLSTKQGATTKDEDASKEGENHHNSGNIFGIKWRPRSVRTKSCMKQSQSSGSEPETKVKEPTSAKAPGEVRYGLGITNGFLVNYSKMEPPSANSMSQDLPLPPGRRRYLFPDSQRASLLKEANQFIINL